MIDKIKKLFDKSRPSEKQEWRTDTSILQFLKSNIDDNGMLTESASNLPDENSSEEDNKVKFAPGLMDAMFGADNSDEAKHRINDLSKLLKSVATKGDQESELKFYEMITKMKV